VICSACGAENAVTAKFCLQCGMAFARSCPACGAPVPTAARYCSECGRELEADGGSPGSQGRGRPAATPNVAAGPRLVPAGGLARAGSGAVVSGPASGQAPAPTAERRLVTVLFADLVGFTVLSEPADPEDVRELLSAYFDICTSLIERYGGMVEKFIGDAVMALWGAPVAQEDDAERAVRTALDLTQAVALLGEELGRPELQLRAGVATGEAAVNLRARGQGMVAGDLVNTASRIQTAAAPGTVLVSDATRRTTEAAISYKDAGTHLLKGKEEPVQLYEAVRVVAGVGGLMKSEGLEPPFVGRDRELRFVKDLFHATAEDRRAHLVQVSGIAGIGKSRLSWELFKYLDGLSASAWWHRGRCLSYGEGVTYWALAEMVRGRAGILEAEGRASALTKLHETVVEHVPEEEERRFVEPRLAQLVGLEERSSSDKTELFSAWRLFFERLARTYPVVMVFEDMQWADPSLVEFIDHLLDFSRNHPMLVMTLARPETETSESRRRNVTSIYLEPLDPTSMGRLLDGFVPGLPLELRAKILERAEGVPLYLVETVRMLLDKGLLVREGPAYAPAGEISTLEVPETLHALVASRLDQMPTEERLLVQDAAVLGKSFTRQAVAAVTDRLVGDLDGLLASLVAKEVFSIQLDPRSPERGQYAFVQDLMRTVAYETLSRHDRRRKHLEAADYLESAWGQDEEEIVEVVASHLLSAYRLDESAEDASVTRERARIMLVRAGERAASLAAGEEAEGYFDKAAPLSDSNLERAELVERAGQMAELRGRAEDAIVRYEQAVALFEEAGQTRQAARCEARIAGVEYQMGLIERAVDRMLRAREAMGGDEADPDLATVSAQLGRMLALADRSEEAAPHLEEALELAELLELPEVYAQALGSKAVFLLRRNRLDEAGILLRRSLEVAIEHDLSAAALRAYNNLAVVHEAKDAFADAFELTDRLRELAHRVGDRFWELNCLAGAIGTLVWLGRWDQALAWSDEATSAEELATLGSIAGGVLDTISVHVHRGNIEAADEIVELVQRMLSLPAAEQRSSFAFNMALLARARGNLEAAFESATVAFDTVAMLGLTNQSVKRGLVLAADIALEMGDTGRVEELLAVVQDASPGEVTPWLRAEAARLSARHAATRGEHEVVEPGFAASEGILRRLELVFDLAVVELEHAEWLVEQGRPDEAEPLLAEASATFERLRATPWIERAQRLLAPVAPSGSVAPA
jgi:class 3 adenylate cyclase/tetratricopeptide (TPR) repeat protein